MPRANTIFGVGIDSVDWNNLQRFVEDALTSYQTRFIVTINGEILLKARDNPDYRAILNGADLLIPDSTNVVWVSALKGHHLKGRLPGSVIVPWLCELAAKNQWSIFWLGAKEGIAAQAAARMQEQFPRLNIAGTSSADPDDSKTVELIRQSGADIVLIAYGAPKQEQWIVQHKDQTGAKLLIGVGGTFDMLAGRLPRAPQFLQALHLEWLWRFILQPSRLGRIWNAVIVFPIKALLN